MLFLVFQLGNDRYALRAKSVAEVLPLLSLKRVPHAPPGVIGAFNYRGVLVPAVDLSLLTVGQPSVERLSTRIIVIRCPALGSQDHLLGLVTEHATELLQREPESFVESGIRIRGAPYLGPVLMDSKGTVQLIYEEHLLAQPVRERLFADSPSVISDANRAAP